MLILHQIDLIWLSWFETEIYFSLLCSIRVFQELFLLLLFLVLVLKRAAVDELDIERVYDMSRIEILQGHWKEIIGKFGT